VPADGAAPDQETLRAFARERLAGFKVPAVWQFTDSLPRNANGKVLRAQLIARAKEEHRHDRAAGGLRGQ
jgi:acyl-coenzyme A synthetase/AMP-(fatty) acid ligase